MIPLVVVVVQLIARIEKDVTEKVEILQDQTVILVMEVLQMESALAHQGFPRKRKIIMVHKTGQRLLIIHLSKITANCMVVSLFLKVVGYWTVLSLVLSTHSTNPFPIILP